MINNNLQQDISILQSAFKTFPTHWDGRESILELKQADYNWRQMEWIGWYFEYKAKQILKNDFAQGDKYENITFDLKKTINWDLKSSAIKTDNHKIILNDKIAMDLSIKEHKYHGEIIALCDVMYNDDNRTFQQWHTELKGGKSDYEKDREQRTSVSRYRKTQATLTEILLLVIQEKDLDNLLIMKQGRNSDGNPRNEKYMIDLEKIGDIEKYIVSFGGNNVL
ncbi:MAG: hypothetical protein Ta2D_09080 [Rickettsiales bacterium]|nr:MAG: hypothetical protein Ta2D_09080 [Rickettsiales bacterium]